MNPFEGKAIKFATEQELNHLMEIANSCDLAVCKSIFSTDFPYYTYLSSMVGYGVTNFPNNVSKITYSDFIASLESTEQPEINENINYEEVVKSRAKHAVCSVDMNGMYCVRYDNFVTEKFEDKLSAWKFAYYMMLQWDKNKTYTEQVIDMVNRPPHYTVNGIEVIDVIENYKLNYKLGNVVKYILRADLKGNRLQDLKKALWYLKREIEQSEKQK
jgi:hypothetical protein